MVQARRQPSARRSSRLLGKAPDSPAATKVTKRESRRSSILPPVELDGNDDLIPKTPRKSQKSQPPEQLLTPRTTPSKRQQSPAVKLEDDDDIQSQPKQLATPPKTPQTVYSLAKGLFQRGSATGVVGRDREREFLRDFFTTRRHGALYVNGLPGTGKSALVVEVMSEVRKKQSVHINCMSVGRPENIYSYIYSALTGCESSRPDAQLQKLFYNGRKQYIVVLDELDHILNDNQQQILFKLFEWAADPQSSLVLTGIANALDLTRRFLPRLAANGITPEVLKFLPYTAAEITSIIKSKLHTLSNSDSSDQSPPLMHPAAIQLCAKKTATNGDLRKALDICRRAIEMVEEQTRKKHVEAVNNQTQQSPHSKTAFMNADTLTSLGVAEAPKATVMHVSKVCSTLAGSTVTKIKSLNVYQMTLLCILVLNQNTDTLTSLFERFNHYSANGGDSYDRHPLGKLEYGEFLQLFTALESAGLVSIVRGGVGANSANGGQRRVSAHVQKMDLMTGISGVDLLKDFVKVLI